jgi:sucrose-6-phosphate hydrolase SacC (GH32 family)
LDSKTGINLIQWPIEEIEYLRGHKLSQTDVKLDAGAVVKVQGAAGNQLDVEVVFEYPDVSNVEFTDEAKLDDAFNCSQGGYEHRGIFGPFGLLVLTDENFQEQTAVYFYIARSTDGKWTTRFCNDQSRSSLLPDVEKPVYGSYVKVLPTEDFLALRVLVDRFIVESFVQHGRMVVTSRVYPSVAVDDLANLYLFNNGMTPITVRSIDAYPMKSAVLSAVSAEIPYPFSRTLL